MFCLVCAASCNVLILQNTNSSSEPFELLYLISLFEELFLCVPFHAFILDSDICLLLLGLCFRFEAVCAELHYYYY